MPPDVTALAGRLFNAYTEHQDIERLTLEGDIAEREAYAIQWALIQRHVTAGERVVGKKTGLTSVAKQRQMNTTEPLYGYLMDRTIGADGDSISRANFIHPRVESEILFVMDRPLAGPTVTGQQVIAATRYVLPALEVIDSRFRDFKFTAPDVVADNASAAYVILGGTATVPAELDLRLVGMAVSKNGELLATGAGAAILGHPAGSVAWLVRKMAEMGAGGLEEGDIVLAGALVEAFAIEPGDFMTAEFDHLGSVSIRCTA
ncbi:MAG: 2-keto-4-pentenoate hydratase [Chloroflexota bacterium]